MKETVETLRKKGYKVAVYHTRRYDYKLVQPMLAKGGRTEVVVTSPEGRTATGKAKCSKEDSYDKKFGVRLALDRALENLQKGVLDKSERCVTVTLKGKNEVLTVEQALRLRDELDQKLWPETRNDIARLFGELQIDAGDVLDSFDKLFSGGVSKDPWGYKW